MKLEASIQTKRYLFILEAFKKIYNEQINDTDQELAELLEQYINADDISVSGRKYIKNIVHRWGKTNLNVAMQLNFAKPINPALFGVFGLCVGSATTLRCFFEQWAEFGRILFTFNTTTFLEGDTVATLTFHPDADVVEENIHYQTIQGGIAASLSNLRTVSSASFSPDKIVLPSGISQKSRDAISELAGCPVETTEENIGQLIINKSRLSTLLPAGDSQCNLAYYQLAARRLIDVAPDNMVYKVRSWFIDTIISNNIDHADIVKDLGLSIEFIKEKLVEHNSDINKVKSSVLPTLARHLLQQQGVQIKEIAFKLGYTSASSFNKAYNRWTGHSPADYRKSYIERINNLKF
ncbi:helix-turn-helix domain-containing protein [Thalassotalea crassostreae]|uniref:helix-turn-helix domain-containing protein n=1 Tax=Thalassotalea crassostreae TaxID=1763536 RepID=UPI00083980D8|nr:helix-turn-helix domain-containing protein [Thalassotalea crassostreae]